MVGWLEPGEQIPQVTEDTSNRLSPPLSILSRVLYPALRSLQEISQAWLPLAQFPSPLDSGIHPSGSPSFKWTISVSGPVA